VDLAFPDDLRRDLLEHGRVEDLLERLVRGPFGPRGVLEDVEGRDHVLELEPLLSVAIPAGGLGVDQELEPFAMALETRDHGPVEGNH